MKLIMLSKSAKWTSYLLAGGIVMAVAAGGQVTSGGHRNLSSAVKSLVHDPIAFLAMRSPGARDKGALFQTKPKKVAQKPPAPTERVLPVMRIREPDLAFGPIADPVTDLGPVSLLDIPPVTDPANVLPPVIIPDIPTDPGNPVVPGVPEPATWLTMILGMLATGASLRRQRTASSGSSGRRAIAG